MTATVENNVTQETDSSQSTTVRLRPARQGMAAILISGLPMLSIGIALLCHLLIPNKQVFLTTRVYPGLLEGVLGLYAVLWIIAFFWKALRAKLRDIAPLLAVGALLLEVIDIVTQKFGLLPLPYFPGPDRVLGYLISDWQLLGISTYYSLQLLATGYLIGAILGLVTGISIGWNKHCHYWLMPLLKIIGPIPATAWIPIALVVFPTSFWASVFLITLAVWFPVSVMSSSGIANVRNAYFEVARTLGANDRYLIFKVALPAAFPLIFIGLFMGLGGAFLTLIVAEMLGVKAGLGWYISWAQGWAEYGKVYAAIIIISFIFSSIITLLFKLRDRLLVWQKGVIKW